MRNTNCLFGEVVAPDNLVRAWRQVRSNVPVAMRPFSKGMDGVSVATFDQACEGELARLARDIETGRYEPAPVRWLRLPKPAGGWRTIGILAVRDRVAQRAVHQVLLPRLDDLFLPCSYGFRQGRSRRDAAEALLGYWESGDTWALLADIEACFDRLDHDLLLAALQQHVGDQRLVHLIEQWLANGMIGQPEPEDLQEAAAGSEAEQGDSTLRRGVQGLLDALGGRPIRGGLTPDYEYATYEGAQGARYGAELLLLGASLVAPVLRRAKKAWPVVRHLLHTPAGVVGGVGLALVIAAPLVWRVAARARERAAGVLQGSALSPLLTNLYLHAFDVDMSGQGFHLVRYVDDLVVSCPDEAVARRARWACHEALGRLRLRLNEDKSGLVQWCHGFEYLGVRLEGKIGGQRWPRSI